ncbi:putative phosphatase regulatory subunit-domain-containing protein [Amylostereum chailletii]|nr:putative phosphatase regulatory subunit-domain-containing protein [Amylostereum chailletii]
MARKKSGEPLKSSLKGSSRPSHPSLSIITAPSSVVSTSKSAPATPGKAVHFDAIEHVKLFLAEQKPAAVSRTGSPTEEYDTTSAEEFPSFIYGKDTKGKVVMKEINFSDAPAHAAGGSFPDVILEGVSLSPEIPAINGVVRVRNLAFEKWIAVRFTLDSWQTTSEVTGRYVSSLPPLAGEQEGWDRFAFVIKLHDILPGRERTLLFALRYTVTGREIWDNNAGKDYELRLHQEVSPLPPSIKHVTEQKVAAAEQKRAGEMEDLRTRLEKVVREQQQHGSPASSTKETVGSILAQHTRQHWQRSQSVSPSPSPGPSVERNDGSSPPPLRFRSTNSFSSRYDFASSFRETRQRPIHVRTATHPSVHSPALVQAPAESSTLPVVSTIPFPHRGTPDPSPPQSTTKRNSSPPTGVRPSVEYGSPRDAPEYPSSFRFPADSDEDVITLVPSIRRLGNGAVVCNGHNGRNHQRGGFFGCDGLGVKKTPPGTPLDTPSNVFFPIAELTPTQESTPSTPLPSYVRHNSFPPASGDATKASPTSPMQTRSPLLSPHWPLFRSDSGDSTPSTGSASSESSRSSSPSLDESGLTFSTPLKMLSAEMGGKVQERESPMQHNGGYAELLNRFCFYTGGDAGIPDHVPRTHSASSIEEFLTSQSPRMDDGIYSSPFATPRPARSSVSPSDDRARYQRSGSATPTR